MVANPKAVQAVYDLLAGRPDFDLHQPSEEDVRNTTDVLSHYYSLFGNIYGEAVPLSRNMLEEIVGVIITAYNAGLTT